jgi:hypothetical protein
MSRNNTGVHAKHIMDLFKTPFNIIFMFVVEYAGKTCNKLRADAVIIADLTVSRLTNFFSVIYVKTRLKESVGKVCFLNYFHT